MQQPSQDEQRNLIIAAVLSFAVIGIWQFFVVQPQIEAQQAAQEAARIAAQENPALSSPDAPPQNPLPNATLGLEEALAQSPRVQIDTPRLTGSIALTGGKIDELILKDYNTTIDEDAPPIELLFPQGTSNAYYALYGWSRAGGDFTTPGPRTEWRQERGDVLAPGRPITLVWSNEDDLVFRRTIEIDENYLFTITQSVENRSDATVNLAPYAIVARHGIPQLSGFFVLHEGAVGVLNGELFEYNYQDGWWRDGFDTFQPIPGSRAIGQRVEANAGGWLGFTDKYWLTAVVPEGPDSFSAFFKQTSGPGGQPIYSAETLMQTQTVAPGQTATNVTRLFAGAKELETIKDYQYLFDETERPSGYFGRLADFFTYNSTSRFIDAIDWGWFFFLTKPIFEVLVGINAIVGNMGVAIILLTVLIKTLLFPLAYKSFVSMSKLKKLQPEVKQIQEAAGDDKMKMQQEIMTLYKKERVNPAAGCLPILAQIPIFFSLYKVIFVTLEVRHAPFFGWIEDLSAPDPTSLFNLFGLLPYEVPAFLLIGVWPVLMGFTMWIQQMLNPAPTDPVQEKIFNMLPLLFTFLLGTFAAGLVIYWTMNNLLTIIQQYVIMRSQGVEVNILQNMKRQLGLAPKESQS